MWTFVLLVRTVFISLPGNWWVELTWLEMHHTWSGRAQETVAEVQSSQCTLPLHTFTLSARRNGAHSAALSVFSCLADWKSSLCFIFILLRRDSILIHMTDLLSYFNTASLFRLLRSFEAHCGMHLRKNSFMSFEPSSWAQLMLKCSIFHKNNQFFNSPGEIIKAYYWECVIFDRLVDADTGVYSY